MTAAAVSASPIDPSPPGEKTQSSAARKCHLQGIIRQPFVRRPRRRFTLSALEKITVILGVAPRDRFPLAAFGEPFKRIGAGDFEQPQARLGLGRFRGGERFFYQFRDGVDDVALEEARIGDDCAVKPPIKIPKRRSTVRSGSESTS